MRNTQEIIEGNEDFYNLDPVTIGILLKGVTDAGIGAYDAKKRREIDKAIAEQDAVTQRKLAEDLAKAKTDQDKIRLIDDLLAKARRRKNMPLYIIGSVLGVALFVGVYLIVKKK